MHQVVGRKFSEAGADLFLLVFRWMEGSFEEEVLIILFAHVQVDGRKF